MQLASSVALVTGAARRVGRAIAFGLAREGTQVVVHYGKSEADARATAAELTALGVRAVAVQADLADPGAIALLFQSIQATFGRLDILVNSAAGFRKRSFDAITVDEWDRVLDVNLRAPFLCTQAAARLMAASARPTGEPALVVNLADLSGVQAWRGYVHHGVSKAGLLHLTQIAARELAPGVRVNAIIPGPILPPPGMDPDSAEWAAMGAALPLGRTGSPEDVARAVVYLAQNDFVTGAVLNVDGGQHLTGPQPH